MYDSNFIQLYLPSDLVKYSCLFRIFFVEVADGRWTIKDPQLPFWLSGSVRMGGAVDSVRILFGDIVQVAQVAFFVTFRGT